MVDTEGGDGLDEEERRRQGEEQRRRDEQRRLAAFGMTTELCHAVSAAALAEYRVAPARGSAGGPGTYAYQGGLAELTVQLEDCGYDREDVNSLPIFINTNLQRALLFTSGDEMTGILLRHKEPGTKYPKGNLTHQVISANKAPNQEFLGDVLSFERLPPARHQREKRINELIGDLPVYVYLVHFDLLERHVRSEVSLPSPNQGGGYLKSWLERNIVSPYPIADDDIRGDDTEINFPVDPI